MSNFEQAVRSLAEALGYELVAEGRSLGEQGDEVRRLYRLVPTTLMEELIADEPHYEELHEIVVFLVERVQDLLHVDFDHF